MTPNIKRLIPLIESLEKNKISYNLGGSALLYSMKLTDQVNDWDVLVDCPKDHLLRSIEAFPWIEEHSGDPPFASQYRICIPDINVDLIGGFALHTETGIFRVPLVDSRSWNGVRLSSPELWFVAYSLMQRKAKADLLLKYLKSGGAAPNRELLQRLIREQAIPDFIKADLHEVWESS